MDVTIHLAPDALGLLEAPWERPLEIWRATDVPSLANPPGRSRHPVRFVTAGGARFALKEMDGDLVDRELAVLGHLKAAGVPAVAVAGSVRRSDGAAILVTRVIPGGLTARQLLLRTSLRRDPYVDRLLDALAHGMVELHRAGVFWGDASLANTVIRRDGRRIEAVILDAETSRIYPSLSAGQRAYDLELLVDNVAIGLADIFAAKGRSDDADAAIGLAEAVAARYREIWALVGEPVRLPRPDGPAVRERVAAVRALGYGVREVRLDPAGRGVEFALVLEGVTAAAEELVRRTGLEASNGQAEVLLEDLRSVGTGPDAAYRWRSERVAPTCARLANTVTDRDPLQAYCDLLEHKWLLSERLHADVGLEAALEDFMAAGAPGPERGPASPALAALEEAGELV